MLANKRKKGILLYGYLGEPTMFFLNMVSIKFKKERTNERMLRTNVGGNYYTVPNRRWGPGWARALTHFSQLPFDILTKPHTNSQTLRLVSMMELKL